MQNKPTATFQRGDKIRITIDATVEDPSTCDGLYYSYPAHYGTDHRLLRTDSPAVTVEHLPADPPPMERKPAPGRGDPISVFGFSARVYNCLRRERIHTVRTLLVHSEAQLMDLRNFGSGSLYEVRDVLAAHGLELHS